MEDKCEQIPGAENETVLGNVGVEVMSSVHS